jgi:hypothetical protein
MRVTVKKDIQGIGFRRRHWFRSWIWMIDFLVFSFDRLLFDYVIHTDDS